MQPSTGPVLAFVATLVKLANKFNLPFLPLYTWTGLWTSGMLFVSAITSGSNAVKYLTRFTDEIFSTLISFIFVTEAISDIAGSFGTLILPKALLTLVCAVVTFTTATILKGVRNTPYFSKSVSLKRINICTCFEASLCVMNYSSFVNICH